ncbi:uncharacterized protein LOC129589794 [Paramacrobiotus metropolitanus]|uniref:uncharacterized protein LOC129589794 n=1 Tax=Paramacrobiotus metropolitanus TaxID=2943436 RepID=UPI002445D83B|nr:uncharacterized protein LOC129589794 [Paramacrobiotus metropolitanus]
MLPLLSIFLASWVLVNTHAQPPPQGGAPPPPPPGPPPPTASPPPATASPPPSGGGGGGGASPRPCPQSLQNGGIPMSFPFNSNPIPCNAPAPPNQIYPENILAVDKLRYLWGNVNYCPYTSPYPTNLTGAPVVNQLVNITFDEGSFLISGDELQPPLRPKLLHTYGTTALVSLEIFCNSTYTGVFQAGEVSPGLMRFSLGSIASQSTAFGPSIAIKLLQDFERSVNILAMDNPDGQGTNRNFFLKTFSNFRPAPLVQANIDFLKIFHAAILDLPGTNKAPAGVCTQPLDENRLPLYTASAVDTPKNLVKNPLEVRFIPLVSTDAASTNDFRVDLANTLNNKVGQPIYLVALRDTETSQDITVGKLILRSNLVASSYQDTRLFFQHPRIQQCGA